MSLFYESKHETWSDFSKSTSSFFTQTSVFEKLSADFQP